MLLLEQPAGAEMAASCRRLGGRDLSNSSIELTPVSVIVDEFLNSARSVGFFWEIVLVRFSKRYIIISSIELYSFILVSFSDLD